MTFSSSSITNEGIRIVADVFISLRINMPLTSADQSEGAFHEGDIFADRSSPAFSQATFYEVFNEYTIERLSNLIEISPEILDRNRMSEMADTLAETELLFSSWGIGELTEQEIQTYFPKLKAVFYAAGTVKFLHSRSLIVAFAYSAPRLLMRCR